MVDKTQDATFDKNVKFAIKQKNKNRDIFSAIKKNLKIQRKHGGKPDYPYKVEIKNINNSSLSPTYSRNNNNFKI